MCDYVPQGKILADVCGKDFKRDGKSIPPAAGLIDNRAFYTMADKFGRYSDRRDTKDFSWSDLFRSFWFLLDKARWKWLFLSLLIYEFNLA